MTQEYRCIRCHHLLFKGSLKMLLSKKSNDLAFIEPKCDRCSKINRFYYHPESEVRKDARPTPSLFGDKLDQR